MINIYDHIEVDHECILTSQFIETTNIDYANSTFYILSIDESRDVIQLVAFDDPNGICCEVSSSSIIPMTMFKDHIKWSKPTDNK